MLKLTYTEDNLTLEYLTSELSEWVNTRIFLALRTQTNFYLQNSTAAFLIPVTIIEDGDLEILNTAENIEICNCDRDFVEVTIKGLWMASQSDNDEGVFVTAISESTELLLQRLETSKQLCYS